MLTDPKEIEIIANARQKNVRDYLRSRQHFLNIFEDFFFATEFAGQVVLDLGPGHYDFGVLARERGAEVVTVDNDPAVVELGRYKGFSVVESRIQDLDFEIFDRKFDGIFCKFSLNSFWYANNPALQRPFLQRLLALIKLDGWGWIAPWNGIPKTATLSSNMIKDILQDQIDVMHSNGFRSFHLSDAQAVRYGVHGVVANNVLFVRGLDLSRAAGDRN